jgi:serine/threonine protein kinase
MAAVFRAYDGRLGRYVALKILAPELAADEAFRQRFVRESRTAAAVDDPHVIPVFEAGESDGVLFIAMRYVRGGDVGSLIGRSGPLPAARVKEIVAQAASALDAAHARGLVHRDVKPANMLLESSGGIRDRSDHVYLSDFGLSKGTLAPSRLTAKNQFLGTLDYAAPEQIEGRPLDGASDQYALACSAFEMLCGEPPFRREQGVSVMYAHLSEPPPLVTGRRPDLPAAVDEVLAKGLAKAPGDRYASCREFAAALRLALSAAGSVMDRGQEGRVRRSRLATRRTQLSR